MTAQHLGPERYEVADASGFGTHYQVWTHADHTSGDPRGTFSLTVSSGPVHRTLIDRGTFTAAMDRMRDEVAAELDAEVAT